MSFELLSCVVLNRYLPEHGLRKGDLGAVVEVYEPEGLEVEFVTAYGSTRALLTLHKRDVRDISASDMLSVRSTRSAG